MIAAERKKNVSELEINPDLKKPKCKQMRSFNAQHSNKFTWEMCVFTQSFHVNSETIIPTNNFTHFIMCN